MSRVNGLKNMIFLCLVKHKNMKGYININTQIIVKDFSNFYPILFIYVDKFFKSNWDLFHEILYKIMYICLVYRLNGLSILLVLY